VINRDCTQQDRRASVGCYLVQDDGTVWCVYNRCPHGHAEVTCLYSPLEDDKAAGDQSAAVKQGG
jgi:nitrite reductase/ring-hydroxylating ferredoxin subunit